MKEHNKIDWPLLSANDIEVRIATCKDGKTTLLLYQNSRTAMNAFDRMFGEFGWQCEYYNAGGQIYCKIGVYSETLQSWVWKSDTGSESNIEAEKGFSSDCFKRVAVRWGFGRELYTAPKITISNDNKYMKYSVGEIGYNANREICKLSIVDAYGNIVYTFGGNQQQGQTATQQQTKEQPTENGYIPKQLYAQTANAATVDELKTIWDKNPEWQKNKNFIQQVAKKKAALTA